MYQAEMDPEHPRFPLGEDELARLKARSRERFRKRVGRELDAIRESAGLTRAEVARRMGTQPHYITKILAGANSTIRTLADFHTACGSEPCAIDLWTWALEEGEIALEEVRQGLA